jgi:RNA polymerase sigma-70 factor (ECF subfamily)
MSAIQHQARHFSLTDQHPQHPNQRTDVSSGRGDVGARGEDSRKRLLFSDFNTWASPGAASYIFSAAPSRWNGSKHSAMSCVRSLVGLDQDFQIMADIAAGESAALTRLYERYSGMVYAICMRVLGNHAEAEECLINVFWEIWNRSARYDAQRAAPLTYITTLARSRAIDRRRSNAVHNHPGVSLDAGTDQSFSSSLPSHGSDPASATLLAEVRSRISSAMQSLDPVHREIIECSYYDGLSHSQIARKLGKPLGTIKTFIRQSLTQLRQALGRDNDDLVPVLARCVNC